MVKPQASLLDARWKKETALASKACAEATYRVQGLGFGFGV